MMKLSFESGLVVRQATTSHHSMKPVRHYTRLAMQQPHFWLAAVTRPIGKQRGQLLPAPVTVAMAASTGSVIERLGGEGSGSGGGGGVWKCVRWLWAGRAPLAPIRAGQWLGEWQEQQGRAQAVSLGVREAAAGLGGRGGRMRVVRGTWASRQIHRQAETSAGGRTGGEGGCRAFTAAAGAAGAAAAASAAAGASAAAAAAAGATGVRRAAVPSCVGLYGYEKLREAQGFKRKAEEAVTQ